jgi:hypothetical protein
MKSVFLLPLFILLTACSAFYPVIDYDPNIDFSKMSRYGWIEPLSQNSKDPLLSNSLLHQRIQSAINQALQNKGYTAVSPETAEFLVTYHISIRDRLDADAITLGMGYGRHNWGFGTNTNIIVHEYQAGTLIIDIVDPDGRNLLWRGSVESRLENDLSPQQRNEQTTSAIEAILAKFPPGADD